MNIKASKREAIQLHEHGGRSSRLVFPCIGLLVSALFLNSCQKARVGPGGPPPHVYPPTGVVTPTITLRPQEETQWCWAASAQMVIEWDHKQASQCTQVTAYEAKYHVNHFYGPCCTSDASGSVVHNLGCNIGAFPDDSFNDAKLNFTPTHDGVAVSPEVIEEEIGEHHRPVAFSWLWTNKCSPGQTCGHMMVIVGYTLYNNELTLTVYDPDPVPDSVVRKKGGTVQHFSYAQFKEAKETYTHWKDFYGFADGTIPTQTAGTTLAP